MISNRQFWLRSLLYIMLTVFISTVISEEFFRKGMGNFKIDDMNVMPKIGYSLLKIAIAVGYLKSIRFTIGNTIAVILLALFVRYFAGPFTIGVVGPAMAYFFREKLIHIAHKKG